ncbi:MAG: LysE family transporter [Puniceicoccales bacterium]|jgi:threonine/homoserine/homoserine lactone efflux protein|nr:LysE family transporter [Puniceicoccales bacterium]
METFLIGFGKAAAYHAAGVVSPGPDFAIVLHQSIRRGRRAALFTSWGIAAGIFFHVGYSLFLLQWLIENAPGVLDVVKVACAGYLAWVGAGMLRGALKAMAGRGTGDAAGDATGGDATGSAGDGGAAGTGDGVLPPEGDWVAFRRGLFVNLLNPKVALFFFAGFTNPNIIAPSLPLAYKAAYGCWMALATAGWFSCVSLFFSNPRVAGAFARFARWLDAAVGCVLIVLAGLLLLKT